MPVYPESQHPQIFTFVETLTKIGIAESCRFCDKSCQIETVGFIDPSLTVEEEYLSINATVALRCANDNCLPASDIEMVHRVITSAARWARITFGENQN